MFNSFFAKINLNKNSMIKYGTIANLTMFSIAFILGTDNIMLTFPITLTAIALSFENLEVKPLFKIFKLLFLHISLVTISTIASIYPYIGIIINFITIFFIAYFFTVRYNPKIYKPFIMIYVFAQASSIFTFKDYLIRLLTVLLGVFIVISFLFITSIFSKKNILKDILFQPLTLLNEQINNISKNKFDKKIYLNHSKEMRNLAYIIYKTRYGKSFTTNLGKLTFSLYIILENFNLSLNNYYIDNLKNQTSLENTLFFNQLKLILDSLINSLDYTDKFKDSLMELNKFINLYSNILKYSSIISLLKLLNSNLDMLLKISSKDVKTIFNDWKVSDINKFKNYFKTNFRFGSIRFNFALRISICLTFSLFLGSILSVYKFIWVSITIMSVMQPYYEETISKGRERIKGNLFGIIFVITILSISHNNYIAIITLIISLYLTYAFKEYYKLSTFTAIASISVASLNSSLNVIAINRIIFILFGVLIVLLANKFLFPYKLEKGITQLITKLLNYNYFLIEAYKENNRNLIRDIIILSTLTSNKLFIRNIEFNSEKLNLIIDENNKYIMLAGYNLIKDS